MDFPASANRLISGVKLTAKQGIDRLKAAPAEASAVQEQLRAIPGMDVRPPSQWDIEASFREAKARLLGLWRGYGAPLFR